MAPKTTIAKQPPPGWRFHTGIILFVLGFLSPAFIPLVAATNLPTKWKIGISGLLSIGIPEVLAIVAVAIMGKAGFKYLKSLVFGFLKKHATPDRVSRTRYRIGLVMFVSPILFAWLAPYAPHLIPGYEGHRMAVNLVGDLLLISSLFVLGGDFWDKVRALFVHDARVEILRT